MIEITHLSKSFDNVPVLKDINITINKGDVIALIGPSGCGKSTLLRSINLLVQPSGGDILVDGESILKPGYDKTKVRRKIGMVFQSFNLFNNMTVIENIMAGPIDLLKYSKQQAYDVSIELLNQVGLASSAYKYPNELSGGQKQRVAICRTLAMKPEVILLDEPTSALDPTMVEEVKNVIEKLAKQNNTMLIVTHDMELAKSISNRVLYIDEGVVYESGTPSQIFNHPKLEKTRVFIKQLKQLTFVLNTEDFDFSKCVTELYEYCYNNNIDKKQNNTICLAFEELCKQIIAPAINNQEMKVTFEYSKRKNILSMVVEYGKEKFNPENTNDKLSWKIFSKSISSYNYEEIDGKYKNIVSVKF